MALAFAALGFETAHAADPVAKCQAKKLKAQGKYEFCVKKSAAKVLAGKPDASAVCAAKFSDAISKAGGACRFLNNGDVTVSDLNTGLVWELKDNLDGVVNPANLHDADNRYTWTDWNPGDPFHSDGSAFTTFLYGLNTGTSAAGVTTTGCFADHCDWRLPTVEELLAILDLTLGTCGGGSGPCIDPAAGPMQVDETVGYWSITQFAGGSLPEQNAWAVIFGEVDVGIGANGWDKRSGLPARAVRGGL